MTYLLMSYGVYTLPDTDTDTDAIGLQTHFVGVGVSISVSVGQCEPPLHNTEKLLQKAFASSSSMYG